MPTLETLPASGNYTLIILLESPSRIMIPSRGRFRLKKGYYAYTGSAVGRGTVSLRRRVARHLRKKNIKRWHIDYLLACQKARITAVIACSSTASKECKIAKAIQGIPGAAIPIEGFGASDCRQNCRSHLTYLGEGNVDNMILDAYRRLAGNAEVLRASENWGKRRTDERTHITTGPATICNLGELLSLERECFTTEAYTEREMRDLLKSPNVVARLARVDADIAGFIICVVEDCGSASLGHVVTIDVAIKHRRKSIGLTLLREAEDALFQRNVQAVYLEVRADNTSALQLYRKQGYVETELLEDYYSVGIRALRLMKPFKR